MIYLLTPGKLTEYASGQSISLPLDKRARIASHDYRIWANDKWYRGTLEIITINGRVTVINLLDLENYLMGVVPSEMPANWSLEALKAQAVEKPKSSLAVLQTQGIILKDSGKVKAGFYRAWVGDAMENLNIRRKLVPGTVLEKLTGVPQIVGMSVKACDVNQNATSLQVMGIKKSRDVSGVALAKTLGFETAGILDVAKEGNNWQFTYRGPGNGARGLSQHGADMLAQHGWNFEQILRQYYQDTDGRLRLDYIDSSSMAVRPRKHKQAAAAATEEDSDTN